MNNVIRAPQVRVPGLLSDDALREQLSQVATAQNDQVAPATSAVDFARKVKSEYLDQPMASAIKSAGALAPAPIANLTGALSSGVSALATAPSDKIAAQNSAMKVRSDILTGEGKPGLGSAIGSLLLTGPLGMAASVASPLARIGALSPEEQQQAAQDQLDQAKADEQSIRSMTDAREKISGIIDEGQTPGGLRGMMDGGEDPVPAMTAAQGVAANAAAAKDTSEAAKAITDKKLQPKQAWWLDASRSFLTGIPSVFTSSLRGVIEAAEIIGGDGERSDARAWVDTVDQSLDKLLPADKPRAKEFVHQLAAGGGSMVGFMIGGYVARGLGLPQTGATTFLGATSQADAQYQDAEKFDATSVQKLIAYMAGAGLGATEAIPIDRMLRHVENATGGLVSNMLKKVYVGGLPEFLQELGQNIGSDVVAKLTYDQNRDIDWKGALQAGAIGGITGTLAHTAISVIENSGAIAPEGAPVAPVDPGQQTKLIEAFIQDTVAQNRVAQEVHETALDAADLAEPTVLPTLNTITDPVAAVAKPVAPVDPVAVAKELKADYATAKRPGFHIADDLVKTFERPPLYDAPTVVAEGGTVPAPNADGTITLRHWSPAQQTEIDPDKFGTGGVIGAERARLVGPDAVNRSYYGVRSEADAVKPTMTKAEYMRLSADERAAIAQLGGTSVRPVDIKTAMEARYEAENRGRGYTPDVTGSFIHEVQVKPGELYNVNEDPLNLRAQLPEGAPETERLTRYEKLISEAGFKGAYFPNTKLGQTAILFDKRTPSRVIDSRYGLPTDQIATPEDFKTNPQEAFKKAGWAVVTGTQEAQGPALSAENVAANQKLRERLTRDGVQFEPVSGAYKGEPQGESFLIFAPEDYAMRIGKAFKQESVLTKDGLLYGDGRVTPVNPAGNVFGEAAKTQDFFSTLPGGEAFSLGLDFNNSFDRNAVLVHPDDVQLEPDELAPLEGLKSGKPVARVVQAARAYARSVGLPVRRQATYVKADPDRGARIAQAYEEMQHNPEDPAVKAAFKAMIDETLAQYQFVKASGLQVEAIEPGAPDPYPEGPKQVLADLEKGHLWFFPTESGFGTLTEAEKTNPLLAPTAETLGDRVLLANDVFRIVHDFFGHGIEGSGFGARGEENAWQSHMRLFSEAALPAVTSETRGQNSWVNFGPHGEANRTNQKETVYADQKTGLMPAWTWREGVSDEYIDFDDGDLFGRREPQPERLVKLMQQVPGFKGVSKYLTAEEKEGLRADSALKIVDLFTNLPSPQEMAAVAYSGRAKRGWYARSSQTILDIFGVEDAPRFAALLAALSPQTSVESNAINTLRVWTAWSKAGRPTDAKAIKRILALNVEGSGEDSSVLPAWIPNSISALTAEDPQSIRLSGPKVDSFMRNLTFNVNEVTNDTWMANYALVSQTMFSKSGANNKGPGYKAFSAVVRAAAESATKITGQVWTPAEVQETVWSWAKALYEGASAQVPAAKLLDAGGLTAEAIGNTPDFSTLFTSGAFRRILEEGGYDLTGIEQSSERPDDATAAGGDPRSAEGTTLDQRAFERHLKRAARRLDEVRKQRDAARAEADGSNRVAEVEEPNPVDEQPLPDQLSSFSDTDLDDFLGQTARNRAPYEGEQQRDPAGTEGQASAEQDDTNLRAISDVFIKALGLTARQGRFTLKGSNVMGQYSKKQGVIRLRTHNDLSTLVHEGGHALQMAAGSKLTAFINSHEKELMDAATAMYGGDTATMPKATHIAEGFAEFFRVFTLNPAYAAKHYAKLTQDFNDTLDKQAPELKASLKAVGDSFAAWLQLPSAQLVRNMVTSGERITPINEAIKEIQEGGFGTWFHEVARNAVDASVNRFASVNDLVTGMLNKAQENNGVSLDLKRADDPRVLIRLAANSGSRAMVQTTDGVMGYHSNTPETRGLQEALLRYHGQPADGKIKAVDPVRQKDFAAYLIALRGIDEYRRFAEGKIERPPVAATLGDAIKAVEEYNKQYPNDFAEAAAIVHEYGMGLWKKAYDAGLMSRETYRDGLDRQFYAPLERDMSDKKNVTAGEIAGGQAQSIVKRFKGSDRNIVDPMTTLMNKTFSLERVIAENDIKKTLAQLADRVGTAGAMVERIPASQMMGTSYSVQEVARALTKDDSLTEMDAQDLMTTLEGSIADGNMLSLFRSQQAMAKGENVVFFWEKGKVAAIQIKDGDAGAAVVNVLNGIGRENLPLFAGLLAQTTGVFRSAITLWPDFLVVNFVRDQMSAWILSGVGYKPFVTGLKGVGDELRQSEWARQYNASAGIMGGMNVAALHEARVDHDINALRSKGYIAKAFAGKGLLGALQGIARVTELSETGTRMGVYKKFYERAIKDGLSEHEASVEAGYGATDLMDFGLNGSRMLLFRRTIPFLNAQLQGLYKLGRTLGGDEVRQRKGINFALKAYFKDINKLDLSRTEKQALQTGRKAWMYMASLGLFSALLHFMFKDDPDYQEAGEYLRTTGWVIPLGDGRLFYIPKPFELAMVANAVERGLEYASGDKAAPGRFLRGAAMNLAPPTSPPLIKAAIEEAANYNFFSDQQIVPDYMQALSPELQYNNRTTELAKQIGQITGMSPLRIDHVMSGLGASAYRDVTNLYNQTDSNRPDMDRVDIPVIRRFVRDARRGSTTGKDFWDFASTTDGVLRGAELSYRTMLEAGQVKAADEFLDTLDPDAKAYALLNVNFKADAKRLNPFYRGRQLTTIVSAMRREMVSPLGVEDSTTKFSEPMQLSSTEKAELDIALSEYARREMRNTLVYMKAPGWENKAPLDTEKTLELIDAINPAIGDELQRRIKKAKVYSAQVVQDYWPEVKDRLIEDRENTFLGDIVSIAKAMP